MQKLLLIMAALLLTACSTPEENIVLVDGWIRQPPPGMAMTAGFGVIENRGAGPVQIVGIETTDSSTAELHVTRIENEVARMRPVASLPLAAGEAATLAPGGLHLMIMGITTELAPGNRVELALVDDAGRRWPAVLTVRAN